MAQSALLRLPPGPCPHTSRHDPPRHARHRFRHLQLRHGLGCARRHGAADCPGGRGHGHAHGGVLQQRRPQHPLRPRCGGALPGRHRGAADALAQEPAGQPAAAGDDGGQQPADQLSGHHCHLSGHAARTRHPGAGRGAHTRGDGAAGAFCGRRPRARCAGTSLAAAGGAGGGFHGRDVPAGADCRGAGLRTPAGPGKHGAGGGPGWRHFGLHRGAPGARAHAAGRPQPGHSGHHRCAHWRHGLRPQAQPGAGDAAAGLPPHRPRGARGAQSHLLRPLHLAPDPLAVPAARHRPGAGAVDQLHRRAPAPAPDAGAAGAPGPPHCARG